MRARAAFLALLLALPTCNRTDACKTFASVFTYVTGIALPVLTVIAPNLPPEQQAIYVAAKLTLLGLGASVNSTCATGAPTVEDLTSATTAALQLLEILRAHPQDGTRDINGPWLDPHELDAQLAQAHRLAAGLAEERAKGAR